LFSGGEQNRSGEETGQARGLGARPIKGRSEAERLDAAPALRTIIAEKWGRMPHVLSLFTGLFVSKRPR